MPDVIVYPKQRTSPSRFNTMDLKRYILMAKIAQQKLENTLCTSNNVESFLKNIGSIFGWNTSDLSEEIARLEFSDVTEYLEDLTQVYDLVWEHPDAVAFSKKTNNDYAYSLYALDIDNLPISQLSLIGGIASSFVLIVGPIAESTKLTYVYNLNIVLETLDFLEKEIRCSN